MLYLRLGPRLWWQISMFCGMVTWFGIDTHLDGQTRENLPCYADKHLQHLNINYLNTFWHSVNVLCNHIKWWHMINKSTWYVGMELLLYCWIGSTLLSVQIIICIEFPVSYSCKMLHIDGLVPDCSNSSVITMELLQSCTKPLIYYYCQTHKVSEIKCNLSTK